MSRCPDARWMPIPENDTQPRITPTQVILHLSAGESTSLYRYWTSPGIELESHFYSPRVEQLEQYLDSNVQGDANYTANRRPDGSGAVSVETQGADANGEWNAKQQADIVNILVWAKRELSIPLRLCPGPNDPGIGWHVMWGSPGAWTPASKVCPGPNRIRQIPALIERAQNIINGAPEDDMYTDTDRARDVQTNAWVRESRARDEHIEAGVFGPLMDDEGKVSALIAAIPAAVKAALGTALPGAVVDADALAASVAVSVSNELANRLSN